jgi:predicted amino acid racemase
MKEAGVNARFVLIRNPSLSEIPLIIRYADISLNSELKTIEILSEEAVQQDKKHGVILMVEMGDLREGIIPKDLEIIVERVLQLKNIDLLGIGTNLKCFAGVIPDENNMNEFSEIARKIQDKFGLNLQFISGGNSANYDWIMSTTKIGLINNLRVGTIILLGVGGVNEEPISNFYQDAFIFAAEIVEIKKKPLYPKGTITTNAFGEPSIFQLKDKSKKGFRNHALLNAGRQDIQEKGLFPIDDIELLSASSDYIIVDLKKGDFKLGDELSFHVNYEALLGAMTSPFISKVFI